MSDIVDISNDASERFLELAISGMRCVVLPDVEVLNCEECGLDIPEPRRKAVVGVKFCVGCAEYFERKRRF